MNCIIVITEKLIGKGKDNVVQLEERVRNLRLHPVAFLGGLKG